MADAAGKRTLVHGIGTLVSGDLAAPLLDADAILLRGDRIAAIGRAAELRGEGHDVAVDARGCTVCPGLLDGHVHPVFGDWTPRQNQLGWIEAMVHGGVTTMVSAGEVHLPGRPRDRVGVKALAITAARCFDAFRPLGAKVHAGAPVPERGLTREDFAEMAGAGVRWVGEFGLGTMNTAEEARQVFAWARELGLNGMIHMGGPSIAGSNRIGAEVVAAADAHIVAHVNGGPTSLPVAEIEAAIAGTTRAIEIVHNGNLRSAFAALSRLRDRGELHRLVLGTDSPAGSGVQPLGILRTVAMLAGGDGIAAEQALCCATGNTARWRGLEEVGVIALGRAADLVFLDSPEGGAGTTALESLALGDLPGIGLVMIDGVIRLARSRNTPPARRVPAVTGS